MELTSAIIEVERVPGRCGGAPTLAGSRIGIHHIVTYFRLYGSAERVVEEVFPHLTVEQIQAALAWYEDHREEVDEILRQNRDAYERRRTQRWSTA